MTNGENTISAAPAAGASANTAPGAVDSAQGRAFDRGASDSAEALADRFDQTSFTVNVSLRYHAKRRHWYQALHNAANACSVISAMAVFVAISGEFPTVAKWAAIIPALLTAGDLVYGFSRRADEHRRLYERFSELAQDVAGVAVPTEADVRRVMIARLRIEADEPAAIDTLNVICHNAEAESRGWDEQIVPLRRVDYVFQHICSLRSTYPRRADIA